VAEPGLREKMARMILCPKCKRYVPFVQRDYRIYCKECGREITYNSGKGKGNFKEENVSPPPMETGTYFEGCPLCNPARVTAWIEELPAGFEFFNVFRCETHHDFMIVAKHHGQWQGHERKLVKMLSDILFPGKEIRWEMESIKDHAHCHVLGT